MSMDAKKAVCYSFSLHNIENADAMGYLRVVAPYTRAGVEILAGIEQDEIVLSKIDDADVVILQRNFPLRYTDYQKIVSVAHAQGKPVIFELDDLFFFLPEEHPDRLAHHFTASLLPMLQAMMEVDLVTVATPGLKQELSPYCRKIAVLPNFLDDNLWSLKSPLEPVNPPEKLVIGYMGTNSHRADLLHVLPVLLDLLQRYSRKIALRFWGVKPPEEMLSMPDVEWRPFYSMDYRQFAQFFQTQQADIFIAPLIDHPFNRCKSPLKFFEYTALGVPGVYSAIEPYASVVEHAHTGLLAASLEEWKECLIRLVEEPRLRYELALHAQEYVRRHWLLSQNIAHVLETLRQAQPLPAAGNPWQGIKAVLASINTQSYDYLEGLKKEIYDQKQQIEQDHLRIEQDRLQIEQNQREIEELKVEILSYALSRSWKFTRPFRMISKKIKRSSEKSNA